MPILAKREGAEVLAVPVSHAARQIGNSKYKSGPVACGYCRYQRCDVVDAEKPECLKHRNWNNPSCQNSCNLSQGIEQAAISIAWLLITVFPFLPETLIAYPETIMIVIGLAASFFCHAFYHSVDYIRTRTEKRVPLLSGIFPLVVERFYCFTPYGGKTLLSSAVRGLACLFICVICILYHGIAAIRHQLRMTPLANRLPIHRRIACFKPLCWSFAITHSSDHVTPALPTGGIVGLTPILLAMDWPLFLQGSPAD